MTEEDPNDLTLNMTKDNDYFLREAQTPVKQDLNRSMTPRKGRVTPNKSNMDISIDNEYLEQVDKMEEANKSYQIEIQKLQSAHEEQVLKANMARKEVESLNLRIQEIKEDHQQQESLEAEKHKQAEYDLRMRD